MEYWYKRKEMPDSHRVRISSMVTGNVIGEIHPPHVGTVKLYQVPYGLFKELFVVNRPFLYKGDHATPPEENDDEGGYGIVTQDGLAGLYVTADGWLTSVYSNEDWRGFVKLAAGFVRDKVERIVCVISGDCLSSDLAQLYMDIFGLKVVAVTTDDSARMMELYGTKFIEDFAGQWGTPHHVFLGRKGLSTNIVGQFDDYSEALDYVKGLPYR